MQGPIRVITQFGAQWDTVRDILNKHWGILTSTPGLAKVVAPSPNMIARRAKNLGHLLIKSQFRKEGGETWLSDFPRSRGMFPCERCQICPYVHRSDSFRDALGEREFQIRDLINCSSSKVIYMITCPCRKMYIGKTERPLKISIGEHMHEIKAKDTAKPLAKHFTQYHVGNLEGMTVKGIYPLKLPPRKGDFNRILLQKEKWWIYHLKSLIPLGMNTEFNFQVFLET